MTTGLLLTAGLVVLALTAIAFDALATRRHVTDARLWFATLARLVLAGYLGLAGLLKLPHPAESVRAVRAYQILPESVVPTVGYVLPLLEVGLALLLVIGLATRAAAVISSLLMVAFIIGIASVAARGINIDCGCFGGGGEVAEGATKYTQEIIRDVGLLVLGLFLTHRPASRLALDTTTENDEVLDDDLDDQLALEHELDDGTDHTQRTHHPDQEAVASTASTDRPLQTHHESDQENPS